MNQKSYHIEITLPEGYDEFWEGVAVLKRKTDRQSQVRDALDIWLKDGGFLDATIKVKEIAAD